MSDVKVKLQPIRVPNYILVENPPGRRQDGPNFQASKFHVSELDDETLNQLCDEFRENLFKKARKEVAEQ